MWFSKSYLSSVGIIFKAGLINHLYPACLKALNSVSGEDLKPEHYRQDGCGGFLKEWRTDLSFLLCNLKYIDPLCWKVLAQGPAGESYTVLKLQLSCPLQAVSCLKKMRVLSCFIVPSPCCLTAELHMFSAFWEGDSNVSHGGSDSSWS